MSERQEAVELKLDRFSRAALAVIAACLLWLCFGRAMEPERLTAGPVVSGQTIRVEIVRVGGYDLEQYIDDRSAFPIRIVGRGGP